MDFSLGETQGRRFRARFRFCVFSQNASLEARCSDKCNLGAARNSPKSSICLYRSTRFPFCKNRFFRKRENVPISDTCPKDLITVRFRRGPRGRLLAPPGALTPRRGLSFNYPGSLAAACPPAPAGGLTINYAGTPAPAGGLTINSGRQES